MTEAAMTWTGFGVMERRGTSYASSEVLTQTTTVSEQ